MPQDRHLPNYGVIAGYEGTLDIVSDIWHHTFHIKMPEIPLTPYSNFSCHLCYFKDCAACAIFNITHMESYQMHTTIRKELLNIMEKAKAMLPSLPSSMDERDKRTILPLGNIFSELFGVSSVEQVQSLQKHIAFINKNQQKLAKIFATEFSNMASFESLTSQRIDFALSSLETVHEQIKNLSMIETDVLHALDIHTRATAMLLNQMHAGQRLLEKFREFKQGLSMLQQGKLPITLISKQDLSNVLHNIQSTLNSLDSKFHLIFNQPEQYYRNSKVIYGKHENDIYINLAIPIRNTPTFYAYSLTAYPIAIPNSEHTTIISDLPDIFLISADLSLQTTFSHIDFIACKQDIFGICNKQYTLSHGSITCPYALLFDLKEHVNNVCSFHVQSSSIKSQLLKVPPHHILISNTSHITQTCNNKQPKSMIGCTSHCVLPQTCNCQYSSGHTIIPPQLLQCYNSTDSSEIAYLTNLAVLQQFFTNEQHRDINSDSMLPTEPEIQIPTIKLYDHHFKELLATDDEHKRKLNKVVKDAKQGRASYANLAEAMVDKLPVLSTSSQWSTMSVPYISLILAIVSLLMNLFLLYKLRALTIALSLLKPVDSAVITAPSLIYGSSPTTVPTVSSCSASWPDVIMYIMMVMLTILIANCVYKLYSSLAMFRHNNSTTLCLYITGSGKCLVAPLLVLPECPAAYSIANIHNINSLNVDFSLYGSKLTIDWGNTNILSDITQQNVDLPNNVSINPILAWKLNNMLKNACAF